MSQGHLDHIRDSAQPMPWTPHRLHGQEHLGQVAPVGNFRAPPVPCKPQSPRNPRTDPRTDSAPSTGATKTMEPYQPREPQSPEENPGGRARTTTKSRKPAWVSPPQTLRDQEEPPPPFSCPHWALTCWPSSSVAQYTSSYLMIRSCGGSSHESWILVSDSASAWKSAGWAGTATPPRQAP